jgi:hypothetical protein
MAKKICVVAFITLKLRGNSIAVWIISIIWPQILRQSNLTALAGYIAHLSSG